MTKKTVLG